MILLRAVIICSLSLLMWSKVAFSAFGFLYLDGNWSVYSAQDKCEAVNRPVVEAISAPYMYVKLVRRMDTDGISIEAYYWPNAVKEGSKAALQFWTPGNQQVDVPAEAILDHVVRTDRSLSKKEVEQLAAPAYFGVRYSDASLVVDASKLRIIAVQLEACIKGLKNHAKE